MPESVLLVVQTPNRGGQRGHQFLITRINPEDFDPHAWMETKNDTLILTLARVQKTALRQFRTSVESTKFIHYLIQTRQAPNLVINVTLDFALPSRTDVFYAIKRWHYAIEQKRIRDHNQYIAELERSIECHKRYIVSIRRSIKKYRIYLKQSQLLSGIHLHYERVLIADKKCDLRDTQIELKQIQKNLVRAYALRAKSPPP